MLEERRVESYTLRPVMPTDWEGKEGKNSRRQTSSNSVEPINRVGRSGHTLPSQQLDQLVRTNEESPATTTQLQLHTTTMDAQRNAELTQPAMTDRKLVIKVPEKLLTSLRTSCAEKANVSLLGRIQGKHLGLKALIAWPRDTLHPSLAFLSLKANNLFEITFSTPEGRIHALTQTKLMCEATYISFSSWRPHFDRTQQANDQLDFPVWLQIVDLSQILRDETFLRIMREHIGHVITIDNCEAYRAKLFGPRV